MSARVPLAIVRAQTRRSARVMAGDRAKILLNAAILLFGFGPALLVGYLLLPTAGEAVAAGGLGSVDGVTVVEAATGGVALVWLLLVVVATLRTVTNAANLDEPACLLVSTSLRNVVLGVLGTQLLLFALWVLPAVLVLSGLFASGYGSPLPVAIASLVAAALLLTAVPVGFVLGVWIRHLLTTYEPIARYRTPLLVAVAVAYFAAISMGWIDQLVGRTFSLFADSPLGWPGQLLLVAVPDASLSMAPLLGAALGTVLVPLAAVWVATRSVAVHWFADPAQTDDGGDEPAAPGGFDDALGRVLDDLPGLGVDRPVRAIAVTSIRRSVRAPVRLLYAAYPLFGAVAFVEEIVQTGTLPTFAAVLLGGYVVWGSGVLFTLNPLGDPGRALPAVLSAPISGREATTGLVLAGALVGVPLAIVVAPIAGFASPLSLEATAALLVGTVVGAVVAPVLATGIGTAFPRFGSVRVTSNREAVMPSKTAFLAYTLALALPAGAAAVLYTDAAPTVANTASLLLSVLPIADVTVPSTAVTAVAIAVLALGVLAPFASFRYATRRFDAFTVD